MFYTQDLRNAFPNQTVKEKFEHLKEKLPAAVQQIRTWQKDGTLPLLSLPAQTSDIDDLQQYAQRFQKFERVVVLGTGGSSLGGQTLVDTKKQLFKTNKPELYFLDNVDPDTFLALFAETDISKTGFIVISKSGTTAETMSSFILCLEQAQRAKLDLKQHFLLITEPGDRPLRAYGEQLGLDILEHDPLVGGRFSVLSLVGLLPAMVAGMDVKSIRKGAASVLDAFDANSAPALGAAWDTAHTDGNGQHSQTVLLPYLDRLASFGLWYRQLWGESVGKEGKGSTPIRAMGTVDQHSQVQLYLAGPADKIFTVMGLEEAPANGLKFPELKDDRLDYLRGKSMGDLLLAEQKATYEALANNNKPVRSITFKQLNEEALGALIMHYMLETMVAAQLLEIDAFDQPAVEEGKVLTRQYMRG